MAATCGTLEGRLLAVLDVLETGVYPNSFSKRGKRQTEEVHCFKQAIRGENQREPLQQFCNQLFQDVGSCIAERSASVDVRRETSYKRFYQKRIKNLNTLWFDFHIVLQLCCLSRT